MFVWNVSFAGQREEHKEKRERGFTLVSQSVDHLWVFRGLDLHCWRSSPGLGTRIKTITKGLFNRWAG